MPELTCPKCQKPIPYQETDAGKAVKCPSCGTDVIVLRAAEKLISLKCASCGGALDYNPGMTQIICPFCHASYLLPLAAAPTTPAVPATLPRYIVPFQITRANLLEPLKAWLNKGAFTAGDADTAATVTAVNAKYVPLYVFTCDAVSTWAGQYSTTHSRPVTRTRTNAQGRAETYQSTESYTEWHPTSGVHNGHYRVAVAAGASLAPGDLDELAGDAGNFSLDRGAAPYQGQKVEETWEQPAFDEAEGRRRAAVKVDALERAACDAQVERLTSCATQTSGWEGRLSWQPFWWITYSYKGKTFNAVMDGGTGAVTGKKPKSKGKIAIAIIGGVILLVIIIIVVVCIAGGYCVSSSTSALDALRDVIGAWA
jgi:LSD1 subclass zinc finger protein